MTSDVNINTDFDPFAYPREKTYNEWVRTTLASIAKELGVTVEELRAEPGKPHAYRGGTLVILPSIARQSVELRRAENAAMRESLVAHEWLRLEKELSNAQLGITWDESTELKPFLFPDERKKCLQCWATQNADGTLPCGH